MVSKEDLVRFEEEIAQLFLSKRIRAPIHLSKGNECELMSIFEALQISKEDWVFSTHRSHLHALLKGIPADWLKEEILVGRSMYLNSKEYRFFTSSIVGGICPIAVGVALAIKRQGGQVRVFCFVGDMASETGIFHESVKYSSRWELPLFWIIEDNGMSTDTPTQEVWGPGPQIQHVIKYSYTRGYPHTGVGKWVSF